MTLPSKADLIAYPLEVVSFLPSRAKFIGSRFAESGNACLSTMPRAVAPALSLASRSNPYHKVMPSLRLHWLVLSRFL